MTRDEKYIARLILKVKFFESDKQTFEDLFTKIMQNADVNFKQVKPQGKFGDGKCDGFNKVTGEFYQVYAPEEISGKEQKANTKMDEAFNGMLEYWTENGFEVKKCNFVVNDKYKSVYASLHTNAEVLGKKNGIKCEIVTCKNIEDKLLRLDDDKIVDVLGSIPDPSKMDSVEYQGMHEIISYLLRSKVPDIKERIPLHPDFEKKIVFNSLSKPISDFLNAGQRQSFAIKEYFELNSKFLKEDLRQIFNSIYQQALNEVPESDTKNDEIFQFIVEKSSPHNSFNYHSAIYVLMAYYFEYCDIFETPVN